MVLSMRCFYCAKIGGEGDFVTLEECEKKHLFTILRANEGNEIELIDGKGCLAVAHVEKDKRITILRKKQFEKPQVKIHLFTAPPRRQKMEQLLKQCAEVGVWSITPISTERAVSKPEKHSIFERWNLLLIEGCKQAHNPFSPNLNSLISLEKAVARVSMEKIQAFFGSTDNSIKNADSMKLENDGETAWFVGPEGGFSEFEKNLMLKSNFIPLKIGPWTMRVETAAIAGASLLINCNRLTAGLLSEISVN